MAELNNIRNFATLPNLLLLDHFCDTSRDAIHTHFVTLIDKWTIVGGWVKHRADKRAKVAKLTLIYEGEVIPPLL